MSAAMKSPFMPTILSDDDVDTWSSGSSTDSGSGYQNFSSSAPVTRNDDYSPYADYFGLSNLINSIPFCEDNPLMQVNNL